MAAEVESVFRQLETYLQNLRFEEGKAAQNGGLAFTSIIIMNSIHIQQANIAKDVARLNRIMGRAYGVSAPELDVLLQVVDSRQ